MSDGPLLQIRDLSVTFRADHGTTAAVRGASVDLTPRECLGVVGESGSGKTQLLLAILGLTPPGASLSGSIRFQDRELLQRPARELNEIRGRHIAMVFQDPGTALNPYMRVGRQIIEALQAHRRMSRAGATERAVSLLESLHLSDAGHRLQQYPHELSGGMRQRVMLAMALINEPAILLADEPTTALDVTVQAQILNVLAEVRARAGTAIMLVTHDLGVIARLADRVAVMYAGEVVELAAVAALFAQPRHPYTDGLKRATPRLDEPLAERMPGISGSPPSPSALPAGCAFAPRCRFRLPVCETTSPTLTQRAPAHWVACHYEGPLHD
jgi:oligopeptide/dipeptide ABC transporter ATP-binding protein